MALRRQPAVRVAAPYYDDPVYIEALASSTRGELGKLAFQPEVILASFHGMPEEYVRKGDPYERHCVETMRLLRERLGFDESKLMLTFQSRFGRAKWLEPATDETVKALAKRGVKSARGGHARLLGRLPGDAGGDRGRECAHLPQGMAARILRRFPASTTARRACRCSGRLALRELKGCGFEERLIVTNELVNDNNGRKIMLSTSLRILAIARRRRARLRPRRTRRARSWTKKAPMAAALNEVALAAVGGKVHVIGGGVLGVAGPYHQEYDTPKDTWRARALLPKGLDHIGVAVLNGKVYTVGGFIGSVHRDGQNAAYEYDPASDTWRILPLMKAGRGSVGVAALDGKIHAIGGRNRRRQCGRRRTNVSIPRPTPGRSWRRCRRRAITRRPWRRTERFTSSAAAPAARRRSRSARHLRSRHQYLVVGAAAADGAQRACRPLYKDLILVFGGELPPNTFARERSL